MFSGFEIGIPALVVQLGAIFLGGSLLLIAWLTVVFRLLKEHKWNAPIPIWLMSAAVICDFVSAKAMDAMPTELLYFQLRNAWFLFLLLGFVFVLVSFVMLREKPISPAPALPTPRDETSVASVVDCFCVIGTEVDHSLVRMSPFISRARNPLSTPNCATGLSSAPEHAF
jgi:uncharacterized membrane protein YfcA